MRQPERNSDRDATRRTHGGTTGRHGNREGPEPLAGRDRERDSIGRGTLPAACDIGSLPSFGRPLAKPRRWDLRAAFVARVLRVPPSSVAPSGVASTAPSSSRGIDLWKQGNTGCRDDQESPAFLGDGEISFAEDAHRSDNLGGKRQENSGGATPSTSPAHRVWSTRERWAPPTGRAARQRFVGSAVSGWPTPGAT